MRIRRIAILIDGGFFLKRLPKLVEARFAETPAAVADSARLLCKRHVQKLTGEPFSAKRSRWLDHVYRLFYYDAEPYTGISHHPLRNEQVSFEKTPGATFRKELFCELRRARKFAVRLGKTVKEDGWHVKDADTIKKLLRIREWIHVLDGAIESARTDSAPPRLSLDQADQLSRIAQAWHCLKPEDLRFGLRQKGVDMRIGLDISTITLKKQADTVILVTGDSDFVPAAKLARREGMEFLIDPLWQTVTDDLLEHVDGVVSACPNPNQPQQEKDALMIQDIETDSE
jgi:uncharacterized LabA/DUF88 family protein